MGEKAEIETVQKPSGGGTLFNVVLTGVGQPGVQSKFQESQGYTEKLALEGKKEKKRNHKAGKMAQWIRALTKIQRIRAQFPASTWQLVPPVTPVPEDPLPTCGLCQ